MSVLVETTLGDFTVDLLVDDAPNASRNFLKLCKVKYYNGTLFFNVQPDYLIQGGDPTGTGTGGTSVYGLMYGDQARYFEDEIRPHLRHNRAGLVSTASAGPNRNASQFIITTGPAAPGLDDRATIFGVVVAGQDTVDAINRVYVDDGGRPMVDVRIRHTYVLLDPFPDPPQLADVIPRSGSPMSARPDAEVVPTRLSVEEAKAAEAAVASGGGAEAAAALEEAVKAAESHNRAVVLEMIGDLPDADITPPDNVLFVCKLNPVTTDADLDLLFSRFGEVKHCDIIRDHDTGASLGYGFVEFASADQCEAAYMKMNNVLVDDRRIKVDFSQSVSKLWNQLRRRRAQGAAAGRDGRGRGGPPHLYRSGGGADGRLREHHGGGDGGGPRPLHGGDGGSRGRDGGSWPGGRHGNDGAHGGASARRDGDRSGPWMGEDDRRRDRRHDDHAGRGEEVRTGAHGVGQWYGGGSHSHHPSHAWHDHEAGRRYRPDDGMGTRTLLPGDREGGGARAPHSHHHDRHHHRSRSPDGSGHHRHRSHRDHGSRDRHGRDDDDGRHRDGDRGRGEGPDMGRRAHPHW